MVQYYPNFVIFSPEKLISPDPLKIRQRVFTEGSRHRNFRLGELDLVAQLEADQGQILV